MAYVGFNAENVEPQVAFEPLPEGRYEVVIVDSDVKTTKAGTGRYLELKCEVISGDFKGRFLFGRLNTENPNEKAQQIGQAQLSALCRAVNVMHINDSSELHNLPFAVKVVQKKREDNGEMTNEIKGYEPRDGKPAEKPVAAATGKAKAPWER